MGFIARQRKAYGDTDPHNLHDYQRITQTSQNSRICVQTCCRSQIFNSHEVEGRRFCIIIHSQPYIYAELSGAQQCLVCPHVSAQTWSSGVRQTPHLCRRNRSKYDMTAKNNTAAKVCSFAAGTANGLYSIFLFAPKFQHLT